MRLAVEMTTLRRAELTKPLKLNNEARAAEVCSAAFVLNPGMKGSRQQLEGQTGLILEAPLSASVASPS